MPPPAAECQSQRQETWSPSCGRGCLPDRQHACVRGFVAADRRPHGDWRRYRLPGVPAMRPGRRRCSGLPVKRGTANVATTTAHYSKDMHENTLGVMRLVEQCAQALIAKRAKQELQESAEVQEPANPISRTGRKVVARGLRILLYFAAFFRAKLLIFFRISTLARTLDQHIGVRIPGGQPKQTT